MFGFDDALVALAGAAGSAGGDIAGNLLGTAYGAHVSRDLMSRQETINRELWRESLLDGPNLQRKGLESAGYNPILALSGFNVPQVSGVSVPSVSSGGISGLGSTSIGSAKEAMKAYSSVKNTNADTELKDTQNKVAEKEVQVKEAQKENLDSQTELNDAKKTKTQVDTLVSPISTLAGGGLTAYGIHKGIEKLKSSKVDPKVEGADSWNKFLEHKKGGSKVSKALKDAASTLGKFGLFALPATIGAFGSAYGTHKVMQHNKGSHWTDKHGIERNPAWIYGGVPIVP